MVEIKKIIGLRPAIIMDALSEIYLLTECQPGV